MKRIRSLLCALVVLTGCGTAAPDFVLGPERPRNALSDAEIEAIATLLRLEDHRRFDDDAFRTLAGDASIEVRRRAATAAGRIGDVAATPLLMRLLDTDPSASVRADAAFALGILGDTSSLVVDALRAAAPRDWRPVRPEETTVVVEIIGALGRIGTDGARGHVVDALRRAHPARDPHSRRIAAEGLLAVWRFPAGTGRALSALRFVDHPDPELRWRAALALVRLGLPEGTSRIVARLDDPDPRVRALAARALRAPAADSAGVGHEALRGLTDAVDDDHPHVRINAVRALATFGDRADQDAIAGRTTDEDANVAVAAVDAVATFGAPAVPALTALVENATSPVAVRAAVLAQLAGLDPDAALPILEAWAAEDQPRRYAVARALAPLGWPRGRALLERLAADPDPRVAIAATEAAAGMAADPDRDTGERAALRELLLRLADAPDPRQRVPALRGLHPLLRAADLPAVLGAYERAVGDPGARAAAIAAVRALGAMAVEVPGATAAFFERFADPGDRWVARAVAEALGAGWGTPPVAAAHDDADFYRDIVRRYVAPAMAAGRRPEATIRTPHGEIRLELLAEEAPLTVHNFLTLANAGYYDDGVWHRVVPNFVLQDGAPAGDPTGGPGWTIRDEINRVRYGRGILGMALAGPDTGGSQWFITHSPQPHLDGGYTVFGRVTAGVRAMDRVVQGDPVTTVRVRH